MMPMGLQDWIHKIEEGEGAKYVKLVIVFLGLGVLITLYDIREFTNFATTEAMDAAQLGRNIAEGRGYTTRFIRPISIAFLQRQRGQDAVVLKEELPDMVNPPVYPLILAGLMKALPFNYDMPVTVTFSKYQPEVIIAFFNQLLFLIVMGMVFFLARKLFDSDVAWTSVALLAGTDLLWRFTVSGLPTIFLMVLFVGIAWSLVLIDQNTREELRSNAWFISMALVIGLMIGLGMMTRYAYGFLLFPVVLQLLLFGGSRRVVLSLAAVAAFLLVVSPWVYRNYHLTGAPFGLATYSIQEETPQYPSNRLERSLPRNLDAELSKASLYDLARKLFQNIAPLVEESLPRFAGNWVGGFFLVALFVPYRNPALVRLKVFLAVTLTGAMVAQALGKTHLSTDYPVVNSENLLVLVAPLACVFGASVFFIIIDQVEMVTPPVRKVAIVVFVLVMSGPLIVRFMPPRNVPLVYPPYFPPMIHDMANWMDKNEMIMSDMPWAVAWYGNRRSIWLTLDYGAEAQSDFFTINDSQKPIQGLFLSPLTMDAKFLSQTVKSREGAWGKFVFESLLRTNVPSGFPLKHAPGGFLPDHLFLSDRVRWKINRK